MNLNSEQKRLIAWYRTLDAGQQMAVRCAARGNPRLMLYFFRRQLGGDLHQPAKVPIPVRDE